VRLLFFGSGAFGRAILQAMVHRGRAPALVVSQPPRGRRAERTPAHAAADALDLPVFAPEKVNRPEALLRLREAGGDLFVVADYGQILSQSLLDIPPQGTINVHASLLPRWRGATPINAAILAGDTETGVTIQRTVRELDAGPVLAARRVPLAAGATAGTLGEELAELGGALLGEVLAAFARGAPPPDVPQDPAVVTICQRITAEDACIDWSAPADAIERAVRAYHPKPGARTTLLREPPVDLTVHRASVAAGEAAPGTIARVEDARIVVGTGRDLLAIEALQAAGRRPMDARSFLNGTRVSAGERLR
jgi:methionyl-tRNA formyltransferase